MEKMFLDFVNVSVSSCWLILAVLIFRLLLKKAPKNISCILWAVVGLRLLIPFNLENPISLVPSAEVFPEEFLYAAKPEINSGFEFIDNAFNPIIAEALAPAPGASANPTQLNAIIFPVIWVAGVVLILIYMLASFLRVKYKVREAAFLFDEIWCCDNISTPFILGIIRPKIYVPSSMTAEDGIYVISHEKVHIKRLDYVWKPLGFLVLALHWFNPAVWLAYVMFCRDIEFACDEKVIRLIGAEKKQEYSTALLNLSVPKHIISACPLAFGENGVKERIKGVLNYKKPALWVILVAVVLAVASVVAFFAGPALEAPIDKELEEFITSQIYEQMERDYNKNMYRICEFEVLDSLEDGEKSTVYIWFYYGEYSSDKEGNAVCVNFKKGPAAITAKETNEGYELVEYKVPDDMESIDGIFPAYLNTKLDDFKNAPAKIEAEIHRILFDKAEKYYKTQN
ncbi:MAG: peptidase M56 [Clostridia bacterium]|nr:peptidase M56 [Clostridia bacterium]